MELTQFTQSLPAIIGSAKKTVDAAVELVLPTLEKCDKADFSQLTNDQLSGTDNVLLGLQGRCAAAVDQMQASRKPVTQAWTQFVSENFIGPEKTIEGLKESLANYRRFIAAILHQRAQQAEQQRQRDMWTENERIEFRNKLLLHIQYNVLKLVADTKVSMWTKFQAAADLDTFAKNLDGWIPSTILTDETISWWLKGFQFDWKFNEAITPTSDNVAIRKEIDEQLLPEKAKILAAIPERKLTLANGGEAPIHDVAAEAYTKLEEQTEQLADSTATLIAAEKINAGFELQAVADTPVVPKGTRIKKAYAPENHGHWSAIISWYIGSQFAHLGIEEIEKKFSFMVKAANNIMNAADTVIVGVPVINDFGVTAKKTKI